MVEQLLAKVGKTTFIQYFLLFKFDRKATFESFLHNNSSQCCCDEQWHFARMIFDKHLDKQALEIISQTDNLNPRIIQISKDYLKAL